MNHYVYRIENIQTNEFYIGVRSCKCEINNDKYMGSSSVWNPQYRKDNKDILIKTILGEYSSRVIANDAEVDLFKPFEDDTLCVNKLFSKIPSALGKAQSEEHIQKRKRIGAKNGMYGHPHSEESKRKISEATKGKPKSEETKQKMRDNHPKKGKVTSDEVKAKASATVKAKYKNGFRQATSKPIIVEDLEEGTISEYPSNTDFCLVHGFDKQSVGVFIRKGIPYKKRFKIQYK